MFSGECWCGLVLMLVMITVGGGAESVIGLVCGISCDFGSVLVGLCSSSVFVGWLRSGVLGLLGVVFCGFRFCRLGIVWFVGILVVVVVCGVVFVGCWLGGRVDFPVWWFGGGLFCIVNVLVLVFGFVFSWYLRWVFVGA